MKRDLELPWPPSVNHYYQPYYSKRTKCFAIRKTKKARSYRNQVYYVARSKNATLDRLYLHVIANQPSKGRHDLDNLLKGLCDGLEYANLYKDDSQIDRIIIERGNVVKNGGLIVQVGSINNMLLIP